MGKTLVLAEKPSAGRDLARVLGCHNKGNGYFSNNNYFVTWGLGHLVTLAEPDAYNEKYKEWHMEDLPMLPDMLKLVVIRQTSRQFNIVKKLMVKNEVKEIVIATDAGREGELVARWIIEKVRVNKPLKRLWISSVTDKAIKEGFQNLMSGKHYENLYASAAARAEADWLVGINATRALTCRFNAQLSCGRVQTPTLAMIAAREAEINSFKPKAFYGLVAAAKGIKLVWRNRQTGETRTFDQGSLDKILDSIRHKKARVVEIIKVKKIIPPPQLYNLTELQKDAHKLYGFSAKETLAIMQSLYENHKVLTYPRTDSRFITTDMVETLRDRIRACGQGPYRAKSVPVLKKHYKAAKSFVDNSKVSDHHAIIPTEEPVNIDCFSSKEKKIYDLVVKRFLAALYPSIEFEQTTIKAKIGEELFTAGGKTLLQAGWKEVYDHTFADYEEDEEDTVNLSEQTLPEFKKGDELPVTEYKQTRGKTKPPPPFNEGSLLKAMENPARYMSGENKDLIKTIGKAGGLGTVATRADIIEKLFNSFLIEKKGQDIFLTSKGRQLLELVPQELKSPALTAEWEKKLESIAGGTLDRITFVNDMKDYANLAVREIKNSQKVFKHDNLTRIKCPDCDKYLLEVNGKKGKMHLCPDRECGHRNFVSRMTNARCPQCRKKLELRGTGDKQLFTCSCGYREKMSSFEARKRKERNTLSKKEVSKYMHQQKKNEQQPINTSLADALSRVKVKD